jgi:hypothetical protein
MSKLTQRAPTPEEPTEAIVRRIVARAEARPLQRVRAYLARGRPLAGLPLMALRAQRRQPRPGIRRPAARVRAARP